MSVGDRPVWFYQQADITDPTPYEDDTSVMEGEECMLCQMEFHRGEGIMEMMHRTLDHDRFYFHRDCLRIWFRGREEEILGALDDFGFEVEEREET